MKALNFRSTHSHVFYWIFGSASILLATLLIFSGKWQAATAKSLEQGEPPPPDDSKTSQDINDIFSTQEKAAYSSPIYEGFEGNTMPPVGWTVIQSNTNQTWKISTIFSPYTGTYSADVEHDSSLHNQDEILLSPPIFGDSGSVSLWSKGNIYWCRDTNDNCDLQVWLVRGGWGGSNDVYLGIVDDDWQTSYQWTQSTFDISDYLNGWARIAFRYVGNNGAQVGLDHITISFSGDFSEIYEGFEDNIMPPIGWSLVQSNTTRTWKIQTLGTPYTGSHAADVEYAPGYHKQDEVLLSPPFHGTHGSVTFWSKGSVYWCKTIYDNCDLRVYLVKGNLGGFDDVYLGKADHDWPGSWVWAQSTFDFYNDLNGTARIAFRYVGTDGAQIVLDHISIYSSHEWEFLPLIFNNFHD